MIRMYLCHQTFNPRFEDDFAKGRDFDPDREKAVERRLKKEVGSTHFSQCILKLLPWSLLTQLICPGGPREAPHHTRAAQGGVSHQRNQRQR